MSSKTSSLYDPYFTEEERRDLELVPHDDLTGEIYLQRYLLVLILSKSPPEPLDFELLLEKTRACNLAIRSLISLIYAELEIRKGKQPWWEQLLDEARELACEQLGFTNYLSGVPTNIDNSENPVLRRQKEIEATFDTDEEPTHPAEKPEVGGLGQDTILPQSS